jgi:hypothetical protein
VILVAHDLFKFFWGTDRVHTLARSEDRKLAFFSE